jgi:hypothetical protein
MEKKDTAIRKVGRGALAILLALFVIAVAIPNAGHIVVHPTVSPATVFESSFHDRLMVCFGPVLPLTCIFVGMFRRPMLEHIGWGLLIIFVVWSL